MLSPEQLEGIARLALSGVQREYPNKLDHVLRGADDLRSPRNLHPSFYGCYDWHSAVHAHWTLAALLNRNLIKNPQPVREILDDHLSAPSLAAETAYFQDSGHTSFERPYGWAWLLQLCSELEATPWRDNIRPLEKIVVDRFLDFLPRQDYPARTGVHSNTAFALSLAYDYAHRSNNERLGSLIKARAVTYFGSDRNYPACLEPNGNDFVSPALTEADLMRRVLSKEEFQTWFDLFLPDIEPLLTVPRVADRDDPQIGHLDGLCLSKAWCMNQIAAALPENHRHKANLEESAQAHAKAGLDHIFTGNYLGEHWLGTFALYLEVHP